MSTPTQTEPLADLRQWVVIGVVVAVVVFLPWNALGNDRFLIPREVVIQLMAWLPALALVRRAKGLRLAAVDVALLAYVVAGAASVALATNVWLGLRAWSMSAAAIVVFWVTRALARPAGSFEDDVRARSAAAAEDDAPVRTAEDEGGMGAAEDEGGMRKAEDDARVRMATDDARVRTAEDDARVRAATDDARVRTAEDDARVRAATDDARVRTAEDDAGVRAATDDSRVRAATDDASARFLLLGVWVAVVTSAAAVLLEAHGMLPSVSAPNRGPGGLTGNRNIAGHLLAVGMPVVLAGVWDARRQRRRVIVAVGLMLVAAAIVVARSRGAWLAATAGTAIFGVLALVAPLRRGQAGASAAWLWIAGALAAGVLLAQVPAANLRWVSATPYRDTLGRVFDYESGTGRGRVEQAARAVKMARQRPLLGVGPGNWAVAYTSSAVADGTPDTNFDPASPQPVNRIPNGDLFGTLAERGAIGVVAAGVALAWLARWFWRRAARGDGLGAVGGATVAAAFVGGLFDGVYLRPEPILVLAVVLGTCAAGSREPLASASSLLRAPKNLAAALAIVLGAVGISQQAARLMASPFLGRHHPARVAAVARWDRGNCGQLAQAAVQLAKRRNCDEALRVRDMTLAWCPVWPYLSSVAETCALEGSRAGGAR